MSKHAPRGPRLRNDRMDAQDHTDSGLGYEPCTATAKGSGKRCKRRPIPGGFVCKKHGGGAPQVQRSAKERLMALQPKAIQTLETLLNATDFPTVQLGAAKDVLDRTEGKAGETLTVKGSLTLVNERLLAARKRLARSDDDSQNP